MTTLSIDDARSRDAMWITGDRCRTGGHPENWIGKLMSAAVPPHGADLRNCLEALAYSDVTQLPDSIFPDSGHCRNIRNLGARNSDNKWQQARERVLFR
jgi:hypothetical protein